MAAVWMRLHAELRSRWRAWLALAVVFGVAAGAAIAAFAGARRTETAYPRFVEAQDGFDAFTGGGGDEAYEERYAALRQHPLVLANLVGALPGRVAARTQPALVLRTE